MKKYLLFLFLAFTGIIAKAQTPKDNNDLTSKTKSLPNGKTLLCTDADGIKFYADKVNGNITYTAYDSKGKLLKGTFENPNPGSNSGTKKEKGKAPVGGGATTPVIKDGPVGCTFCVTYLDKNDDPHRTCKAVDCDTRQ